MKMKVFLSIFLLIIAETMGGRLKRMVGGEPMAIEKVPYQVSIRFYNYHVCGGALISPRHVLTAAHCVANLFDEPYDELNVVTGTDVLSKGGTVNKVKNVVWHEGFTNGLALTWNNNDIAVLTLQRDIETNKIQQPIMLPTEEPTINGTGIISGFGRVVTENAFPSTILRSIKTRILPSVACQKFMKKQVILETQICGMQENGTGVCYGDSGGPLVLDGKIVGVASWVFPCGKGIPDVYTNVYKYLNFIKKAMRSCWPICTIS